MKNDRNAPPKETPHVSPLAPRHVPLFTLLTYKTITKELVNVTTLSK